MRIAGHPVFRLAPIVIFLIVVGIFFQFSREERAPEPEGSVIEFESPEVIPSIDQPIPDFDEDLLELLRQLHLAELMGRIDLVRNSLQRYQAMDPNSLDALFFDAYQHMYAGAEAEAKSVLLVMQGMAPEALRTLQLNSYLDALTVRKDELQRARLLSTAGRYDEAGVIYLSLFPHGMPTLSLELEYLRIQARIPGQWKATREVLEERNRRYPDFPPLELALADHIAMRYRSHPWVLETYERLSHGHGLGRQAASSWLNLMRRLPLTDALVSKYELLAKRYPNDLDIQENYKRALEEREAERQRMRDPHYRAKRRGLALLEAGRVNEALEKLLFSVQGRPDDEEVVGGIGILYLRLGEQAKAVDYFRLALKENVNPDMRSKWQGLLTTSRYWAALKRADVLLEAGEYDQARDVLEEARAIAAHLHYVYLRFANLAIAEGNVTRADHYYRHVLSIKPLNKGALEGRINLHLDSGSTTEALALIESYSPGQRAVIKEFERDLRVDFALAKIDVARASGLAENILLAVEAALALEPVSPWHRSDIATAMLELGQAERADEHMRQWVEAEPYPEMLFAFALYESSRERVEEAIAVLESVPGEDRSDAMLNNLNRLKFDRQLSAIEGADMSAISRHLDTLERQNTGRPDALLRIARQWKLQGELERARAIAAGMVPSTEWPFSRQIRYAELLLDVGEESAFTSWYLAMREQNLDSSQRQALQVLEGYSLFVRAQKLEAVKNIDVAYAFYRQSGEVSGSFQLAAKLGALRLARAVAGEATYLMMREQFLASMPMLSPSGLGSLAKVFHASSDLDARDRVLEVLLDRPEATALDLRNGMLLAEETADWTLTEKLAVASLGKLSGKDNAATKTLYQEAGDDWLSRNLKSRLDRIRDRDDGHIVFGLDQSVRDGQEESFQVPIELRLPVSSLDGHFIGRLDYVSIDSGKVDYIDRVAQVPLATRRIKFSEKATGVAIGIGWRANRWWADVGTTPLGFREQNWVGGVRLKGSVSQIGWRLNLSRRPEDGTALSYAGMEVPANASARSGEEWGGVLRSGVKLGLSYDRGGELGYWASLQYHNLNGENVEENNRLGVLGGVYWRAYETEPHNWRFGINLLHLRYDKNLELRAVEQGGYFSPQNYLSLSLPVRYFGRRNSTWAYMIGAGVGKSWKTEDDPSGFGEGSSRGGGFGYSLEAALEKRVSKRWYLGVSADIQRADFYEPDHFQLYARYTFNDRWQPIPTPPEPPVLYSNFD